MEWTSRKPGDVRVIKRYLFSPLSLPTSDSHHSQTTRWLEEAYIRQRLGKPDYENLNQMLWQHTRWATKEEYENR